jgi:hypothetical protein
MLAGCGSVAGGGDLPALLARGAPELCSAPDVQARLRAALAPDTRAPKRLVESGEYPVRASDIDSFAQGLVFTFDGFGLVRAEPDRRTATCGATLAVSSPQYGVATSEPVAVRYRVSADRVDLLDPRPLREAQRVFGDVLAKVSDVFGTSSEAAAVATDATTLASNQALPADGQVNAGAR